MTGIWDDDDDWFSLIDDIIKRSFTGGYIPRRNDYWIREKGIIYTSNNLEMLDFGDYVSITKYMYGYMGNSPEVNKERSAEMVSNMTNDEIKVNPETAKITFNNFILDIEMEKVKE